VRPEQGIQAPGDDARHSPIPLDALSPPARIGEELNSLLQSNVMRGNRPVLAGSNARIISTVSSPVVQMLPAGVAS
jgi:hypothetical protein